MTNSRWNEYLLNINFCWHTILIWKTTWFWVYLSSPPFKAETKPCKSQKQLQKWHKIDMFIIAEFAIYFRSWKYNFKFNFLFKCVLVNTYKYTIRYCDIKREKSSKPKIEWFKLKKNSRLKSTTTVPKHSSGTIYFNLSSIQFEKKNHHITTTLMTALAQAYKITQNMWKFWIEVWKKRNNNNYSVDNFNSGIIKFNIVARGKRKRQEKSDGRMGGRIEGIL